MAKISTHIFSKDLKILPFLFEKVDNIGHEFSANSPPSVFVGSKLSYPKVNVGILVPPEHSHDSWMMDKPSQWVKRKYGIREILDLRSRLVNSRFPSTVYSLNDRLTTIAQEIAMASEPVDIEVSLGRKISLSLSLSNVTMPLGPNAQLDNAKIISNIKVERPIEKVISDSDLSANLAIDYLYQNKFEEQTISKLLSVGLLGTKNKRRLVPTRWSITSVDDNLAKFLVKDVITYDTIDNYQLYHGKYLGNNYFVLLFPKMYGFELFEIYLPGSSWNQKEVITVSSDYEDRHGRKSYASNTAGGYYATKLGILEHLEKIKRQACILVIRIETPEYWASLGVWVVREAARKTMATKPVTFENQKTMIAFISNYIMKYFKYDVSNVYAKSVLLNNIMKQKSLLNFR